MKTIAKITNELEDISKELLSLMSEVSVKLLDRSYGIVILAPDYYWGELSPEQKSHQIRLKRKYDVISEVIRSLLNNAPSDILREVDEADQNFRMWLEFDSNWSLRDNINENESKFRKDKNLLDNVISILSSGKSNDEIIIPDTNSLLFNPDPVTYRVLCNSEKMTFLLLPTVLCELDELKILHRNPEVREKANKCIKRIKGWRNQGSLSEGILIDGSIRVRAGHKEPDMKNTLSWLDSDNSDDRIIASVLAIQAECPNSRVMLATGDINLQNKADAAYIEVGEV